MAEDVLQMIAVVLQDVVVFVLALPARAGNSTKPCRAGGIRA
jgi:hypothetical protein